MAWRLARSLETLRKQINAAYPGRDKASDGTVGDLRHRKSKSDHNPNSAGVVTAIDIDEDVDATGTAMPIVDALLASRDPRIKYIIYEGRIVSSKQSPWIWRKYSGANPHKQHFHLSVMSDPRLYDDASAWRINLSAAAPTLPSDSVETAKPEPTPSVPPPMPELKRGAKGEAVYRLQMALRAHGFDIKADKDFGPATERAVKGFQTEKGLRPDGIAGSQTYRALGI